MTCKFCDHPCQKAGKRGAEILLYAMQKVPTDGLPKQGMPQGYQANDLQTDLWKRFGARNFADIEGLDQYGAEVKAPPKSVAI